MKKEVDNSTIDKNNLPKILNRIKIQAIARKGIKEGKDLDAIANILMADAYFQEKERKMGVRKVAQLTRETINKALVKEKNTKLQDWLAENPAS